MEGRTTSRRIQLAGRASPGRERLPWHSHPGPTLCFVYAGAFTESFAGATLECTPGTLKITPAGERH